MRYLLLLLLTLSPLALFAAPDREELKAQINEIVAGADVHPVLPTGSMEPNINEKTLILTKMVPWEDLEVGDVIIYQTPEDGLYVHRIWRISSGHSVFVMKGDSNVSIDKWLVTKDMYRGMVVGIIRIDK